jgi:hypothetical protein
MNHSPYFNSTLTNVFYKKKDNGKETSIMFSAEQKNKETRTNVYFLPLLEGKFVSEKLMNTAYPVVKSIQIEKDCISSILNYYKILEIHGPHEDTKVYNAELGLGTAFINVTRKQVSVDHKNGDYDVLELINIIKDMFLSLYNDSGYNNALEVISGVTGLRPIVNILLDVNVYSRIEPVLSHHFSDVDFHVNFTTTLNLQFRNKLMVSFDPDYELPQGKFNPLTFGTFVFGDDLVTDVPKSINLSEDNIDVMKQVNSRYIFINHCPVMGMIDLID